MKKRLNYKAKKTIIISLVLVALFAVAGVGAYLFTKGDDNSQAATTASDNSSQVDNTTTQNEPGTTTENNIENNSSETTSVDNNNSTSTDTNTNNNTQTSTAITNNNGTETSNTRTNTNTNNNNNNNNSTQNTNNIRETVVEDVTIEQEEYGTDGKYLSWTKQEMNAIVNPDFKVKDNNKIEVEKSVDADNNQVEQGEDLTYTIKVSAENEIKYVSVKDIIPEQTTLLSVENNGTEVKSEDGTTVGLRWELELNKNNDFMQEVKFTVKVNEDATGIIENVAVVNGIESNKVKTNVKANIVFEENGGKEVDDILDKNSEEEIEDRTMPTTTRQGYDLEGWYENPEFDGDKVEQLPEKYVAGTTTYYAKWTPRDDTKYTVEYYYQNEDGTYPETATDKTERTGTTETEVAVTDEDKTPDTTNYPNYVLDNSKEDAYTGTVKADGTLVLKVYFKAQYKVTYTDGIESEEVFADKVTGSLDYGSDTPAFGEDPTRTGYDFAGWDPEVADTVTKDQTYTAKWTQIIGTVEINKVDSSDHNRKVKDAEFTLTGTSTIGEDISLTGTTNDNGEIKWDNVPHGTYTVKETKAPDGYEVASNQRVTINTTGETKTLTFEDRLIMANVMLKKIDNSTGEALKNVQFTITGTSTVLGEFSQVKTTDASGIITFTNIPHGSYTLEETEVPAGYVKCENITFDVRTSTTIDLGTIRNTPIIGTVEINKIDSSDHNKKLKDAEFTLTGTSTIGEDISLTGTTNDNGEIKWDNVPHGTYTVKEIAAPTGYDVAQDQTVTISTQGETKTLTFKDTPITGTVVINKEDTTDATKKLENAQFTLTGTSTLGEDISLIGKTNDNGEIKWDNVPHGTYTVKEIAAPTGYDVAQDQTVRINTTGETKTLTFKDTPITGTVVIEKIDSTDSTLKLEGAKFTLTGISTLGDDIALEGTTDASGKIILNNVPHGTYTIEETEPPVGYRTASNKTVTINTNGETKTITIEDETIEYKIKFDKNHDDATGTMEDMTLKYNEEKNLTANAFERYSYEFAGWNTEPDGSGTSYEDKQAVKNLTTVDNDEITLYAQWKLLYARFDTGIIVNVAMKKVANPDANPRSWDSFADNNITTIQRVYEEPTTNDYKEAQTNDSTTPIKMWVDPNDSSKLLWFTKDPEPELNNDCSKMFTKLTALTDKNIDIIDICGTSNVTNMNSMFSGCTSLKELDANKWDTSNVQNMYGMFSRCSVIEKIELDKWDTSKVTTMSWMFDRCHKLDNLDVSKWDVGKVQSMYGMFEYCSALKTLDVSKWNVSSVTNMQEMFDGCSNINNLDVSKWDVSKVTTMNRMFGSCSSMSNIDVSKWNVSKVTNMGSTFSGCQKLENIDVSKWNVSNVTTMSWMFNMCYKLDNLDVSKWDVGKVQSMYGMFEYCSDLKTLDVSKWNVSNVTNMQEMFTGCSSIDNLDVSKWDVSKVTTINQMFSNCSSMSNIDVSKWNVSKVTNMAGAFSRCQKLESIDVSKWDTSNVTSMSTMFFTCTKLEELDLSNWDTSKVTNTNQMFDVCSSLKTIYASDKFVTDQITTSNGMFARCSKLVGGNGTTISGNPVDKTYARIDTEETPGYFTLKGGAGTSSAPSVAPLSNNMTMMPTLNITASIDRPVLEPVDTEEVEVEEEIDANEPTIEEETIIDETSEVVEPVVEEVVDKETNTEVVEDTTTKENEEEVKKEEDNNQKSDDTKTEKEEVQDEKSDKEEKKEAASSKKVKKEETKSKKIEQKDNKQEETLLKEAQKEEIEPKKIEQKDEETKSKKTEQKDNKQEETLLKEAQKEEIEPKKIEQKDDEKDTEEAKKEEVQEEKE